MKRSESPLVRGINDSIVFDEQGGNVQVAIRRRVVQWDESTFVLRIHVGTLLEEIFSYLQVIVAG